MDRTATLGLLVAVAAAVEALQTCSVVLVLEELVQEELALGAFALARRE